jgi:membrane protein YqaA with SNARE-associated domain
METLLEWGLLGLFAGTFLAATILPFSSEILVTGMLYAGASPLWVFVVATLGNWLGSVSTYFIGYLGKWQWIEKWFKITPEKLEKQQKYITKFGSWISLVVWLPVIGDVFSIALGFYKISPYKCIPLCWQARLCALQP